MEKSISVQKFLENLPIYFAKVAKANIIISTYNRVSGYDEGIVDTSKKNLSAHIFTGGLMEAGSFDEAVTGFMTTDWELKEAIVNKVKDEAIEIQKKGASEVEKYLKDKKEGQLVFITYAGLNGYRENVDHAIKIKKEFPHALIFILTCDCIQEDKEKELLPLVKDGIINDLIVSPYCGGRGDLQKMLDGIIEHWK